MSMHFLKWSIAMLIVAALGAFAPAGAEPPRETRVVTVTATEFSFSPARIEAAPGQKLRIKLVNEGQLSHNLHIKNDPAGTETIQTGDSDTFEFTAPKQGEVVFVCDVPGHKQAGMTGRIVVTGT